jgi:formylglycine-generating enzyme required for sulfatase activity
MSTTRQQLRHMTWIPGGTFAMGSAGFYPEERPVHPVTVDGFWMDEHLVTVGEYRRFVVDGAVYAARQAEAVDTATCHLGFRCVVRGDAPPGR